MGQRRYKDVVSTALALILFISLITGGLQASGSPPRLEGYFGFTPPAFGDAPDLPYVGEPYTKRPPSAVKGTINVIVLAVEFAGLNHTIGTDELKKMFFGEMSRYWSEVSYGLISVTGDIYGWYRVDRPITDYSKDCVIPDDVNCDLMPDTWEIAREIVKVIDPHVDFSNYDHIIVVHAGYGQESTRRKEDIWSVTYIAGVAVITQEKTFTMLAVVPEMEAGGMSPLGVYAHEFGHLLGLPDLYIGDPENGNMGPYDLMAKGSWNGNPPGSSPAHLSAWSRLYLGWIAADKVYEVRLADGMTIRIGPIEADQGEPKVVRVPLKGAEGSFYLIEARRRIGFDVALPMEGILIAKVESGGNRLRVRAQDAVPETKTLDDALFRPGGFFVDARAKVALESISEDGLSFQFKLIYRSDLPSIAELLIDSIAIEPASPKPNQTATLNIKIRNVGGRNAGRFFIHVWDNDTRIAFLGKALLAGETQVLRVKWVPSFGVHMIKVVLDPEGSVIELTKANNEAKLRYTVGYKLSLIVNGALAQSLTFSVMINGVTYLVINGSLTVWLDGGKTTIEVPTTIEVSNTTRFVFKGWADGSADPIKTLYLIQDEALVVIYGAVYYVHVDPNGGEASGSGWFEEGSEATIQANPVVLVAEGGTRLIFSHWSGDFQSSSSTLKIVVTGPVRLKANWKKQFYVLVASEAGNPSGTGWYDEGTKVEIRVDPLVDLGNLTRLMFRGWVGDHEGTVTPVTIIVDRAMRIGAVWSRQYLVRLIIKGVPENVTVYIVLNGENRPLSSSTPVEIWVDEGSLLSWEPMNSTISVGSDAYVLQRWVDQSLQQVKPPLRIEGPTLITGEYGKSQMGPQSGQADQPGAQEQAQQQPQQGEINKQTWASRRACIIATAAFGSELEPHVAYLRRFRDKAVMKTEAGGAFMEVFNAFYYSFSPLIAEFIAGQPYVKGAVRAGLYPLIGVLLLGEWVYGVGYGILGSAEASIVVVGILISTLLGLTYLSPLGFLISLNLRRRRRLPNVLRVVLLLALMLAFAVLGLAAAYVGEMRWLLAAASSIIVLCSMALGFVLGLCIIRNALNRQSQALASHKMRRNQP